MFAEINPPRGEIHDDTRGDLFCFGVDLPRGEYPCKCFQQAEKVMAGGGTTPITTVDMLDDE